MNILKINFLIIAILICGFSVSAQNPYPGENETDRFTWSVKFSGEKPSLKDFVQSYLEECGSGDQELNEIAEALAPVWEKYLKNKPQDKHETLIVDTKNGYLRYEGVYTHDNVKEKDVIEMCYWNCSDNKHKLFAISYSNFQNDKPFNTEVTGLSFDIYNNAKRKMTSYYGSELGIELESDDTIVYSLPRVGKTLVATIYKKSGQEKVEFEWNGLKFNKK